MCDYSLSLLFSPPLFSVMPFTTSPGNRISVLDLKSVLLLGAFVSLLFVNQQAFLPSRAPCHLDLVVEIFHATISLSALCALLLLAGRGTR